MSDPVNEFFTELNNLPSTFFEEPMNEPWLDEPWYRQDIGQTSDLDVIRF